MAEVFISFTIAFYILTSFFWILVTQHVTASEVLNPIVIYEEGSTNLLGSWFLAIVANIGFLPISICYWVYMLCTFNKSK